MSERVHVHVFNLQVETYLYSGGGGSLNHPGGSGGGQADGLSGSRRLQATERKNSRYRFRTFGSKVLKFLHDGAEMEKNDFRLKQNVTLITSEEQRGGCI